MVYINGVKITSAEEKTTEQTKKPSINEILDKMQLNYNNVNYSAGQTENNLHGEQKPEQVSVLSKQSGDNSLLLSILPLLLNKGNNAEVLKSQQDELMHTLIKGLNNPLIEKLFELMPKVSKKTTKKVEAESTKKEPAIDSFVKTDEYSINN